MNRISVFVDIAGRPSREIFGSPRVTAGAVLLETASLDKVRQAIPAGFPKWKAMDPTSAIPAMELLLKHALCIAGSTVNRDTEAWRKALVDEPVLQAAIIAESRKASRLGQAPGSSRV